MYELVNTSVPNGLVAGTHGFATVAMTKGMPDAIRSRIENCCGYPHRTSSHDQSYWSENPVNWFHLVLPGGDHAVGRTAPCEFDYTGRTNRISRILCFSAAEMPLNGGAYILSAEARRFCEAWSGEPRYLKDDKVAAANLRTAAPTSGAAPSRWIEMFGAEGAGYARKFALLLAKNITGAGKSIYFKASTAEDADGTRLLGLFSDLINLLPAELASKVTFSTFAPCVPGGVTCHLRGVYDSDRVFEAMSALQPWVDCASRTVKHAELLPEEELTHGGATSGEADVAVRSNIHGLRQGRAPAHEWRPFQDSNVTEHTKKRSDSVVSFIVAVFVVFVLVALGCGAWWYIDQKRKWQDEDAARLDMQIQRGKKEKANEWYIARTNEIHKYEVGIAVRGTNCAELDRIANDVKAFKSRLDKSWRDETSVGGKAYSDESLLQGIKDLCDSLVSSIGKKKNKLESEQKARTNMENDDEARKRKEEEDEERAKKEKKEREKRAKNEAADKGVSIDEIKKKEFAKVAFRGKPLKELSITKVLDSESEVSPFIRRLDKAEKENLVEKDSITIWFVRFKKLKSVNTELARNKKTQLVGKASKEIVEYSFNLPDEVRMCDSPWLLLNIVADESHRHVLWVWRDKWPVDAIFSDGKINKDKFVASCFGSEDAFHVWSRHVNGNVYFEVSPQEGNKGFVYYADAEMKGDDVLHRLAEKRIESTATNDTPEQVNIKRKIEHLKKDLKELKQKKDNRDEAINNALREVKVVEDDFHRFDSMPKEEKSRIDNFGGKSTKRGEERWEKIEKGCRQLEKQLKDNFGGKSTKRGEALWEKIEKGCRQLKKELKKYNKDARYRKDGVEKFLDEIKSAIESIRESAHDEDEKINEKLCELSKQKEVLKKSKADQAGASEEEKGLWAQQRYKVRVMDKMPVGCVLGWN